jgi:hypothetical protein
MPANRSRRPASTSASKDRPEHLEGTPMTADPIMDAINHYAPADQQGLLQVMRATFRIHR